MNKAWDSVPGTCPACVMFLNNPCCNCGDCCTIEERININKHLYLISSIYERGDKVLITMELFNKKKKFKHLEMELSTNELNKSIIKDIYSYLLNKFKSIEINIQKNTLDNYR